jgi:hypothetical protein
MNLLINCLHVLEERSQSVAALISAAALVGICWLLVLTFIIIWLHIFARLGTRVIQPSFLPQNYESLIWVSGSARCTRVVLSLGT